MPRFTNVAAQAATVVEERSLAACYLDETLNLYHEEHRYLRSATWSCPSLAGQFELNHYPFAQADHIDYVTASMIMVYLSQLGFVYTRVLCEEHILPFTHEEFFRLRDEGRIVFSRFHDIRFNDKIYISEGEMVLRMSIDRLLSAAGRFIGEVDFAAGNARCMGRARVAII